jgi:CubicO group peptidase (beta-lactamase class C family)
MRSKVSWVASLGLALVVGGCKSSSSSPAAPVATTDADAPVTDSAPPVLSYDFSAVHDYLFGAPWKTEGVVVLYKGQIVYEEYAAGFGPTNPHITYSVSKSFGSALIGIAIHDGLLQLTDSVCKYVPTPPGADPTICDTTVDHLLHMTSGLAWSEDYGSDPTTSNVLEMLYGYQGDMGAYVMKRPRKAPPNTVWNYSSGDSTLLSRVLRGALGAKDERAWAKQKLFDPAGLASTLFESDRTGTLVFSSSCFMTPRDMAKFGQLYLDDGMSNGVRVLPEGWVKYSQVPAPPVATPATRVPDGGGARDTGGSYGAAFWLNAATPTATPDTFELPDAPVDTYSAEGHWGQVISIVPSQQMVLVRVGNDRDPIYFDASPMIGKSIAAIAKGGK